MSKTLWSKKGAKAFIACIFKLFFLTAAKQLIKYSKRKYQSENSVRGARMNGRVLKNDWITRVAFNNEERLNLVFKDMEEILGKQWKTSGNVDIRPCRQHAMVWCMQSSVLGLISVVPSFPCTALLCRGLEQLTVHIEMFWCSAVERWGGCSLKRIRSS